MLDEIGIIALGHDKEIDYWAPLIWQRWWEKEKDLIIIAMEINIILVMTRLTLLNLKSCKVKPKFILHVKYLMVFYQTDRLE